MTVGEGTRALVGAGEFLDSMRPIDAVTPGNEEAPVVPGASCCLGRGLEDRHRGGLQPLGALHDVELDALAFLEVAVAFGEGRRMGEKNVFAALAGDEAVALAAVEPLDGT